MEVPMRHVPMILAVTAFVLSAFVAAVSIARSQPAGIYRVVLVNLDTGTRHPWARKSWPDQNRCDAALGNANEMLAKLVDPNPEVVPPELNGADQDLQESLLGLLLQTLQRTGTFPRFSISCELQGDPA
jgi:hypothetical protein